ncbi:TPA: substrate import-associated zinc metallohydrolase lipoprotein [Elizabethkingia anophelis]
MFSLVAFVSSCRDSNEKLGESILTNTLPYAQNETDLWLKQNFEAPYNIEVLYRWEPQYVDYNRYMFPPSVVNVKPAMEIVKKLWIDTYSTIGGKNFVKILAPKEVVLIGGVNKNTNGTITLGVAEGGTRIVLFQTDNVIAFLQDPTISTESKKSAVRQFIHTIQHEYVHILNQTKPFDQKAYQAIVRNGGMGQYKSDWYSDRDTVAREKGFITAYAQSNVNEDFAEMAATMLIYPRKEYNSIVSSIANTKAQELIRAKEKIVVAYYKEQFNIDFYALADAASKNSEQVFNSFKK